MRTRIRALPALLAVALAAGAAPIASATAECLTTPERTAFDVEALKNEMMLGALSCGWRPQYNAFVTRFRPEIAAREREVDAWFRKNYGRAAQQQHDAFITQLSNDESTSSLRQGDQFCKTHTPLLDNVTKLQDADDLTAYAQGWGSAREMPAKDCAEPAAAETAEQPAKASPHHAPAARKRH